jgi:hypothetical protein
VREIPLAVHRVYPDKDIDAAVDAIATVSYLDASQSSPPWVRFGRETSGADMTSRGRKKRLESEHTFKK